MNNNVTFLLTWTPFLMEGFLWNIIIGVLAVFLGTVIGGFLAWIQITKSGKAKNIAEFISKFFRNIPTLAFMFYVAFVFPQQVYIPFFTEAFNFPYWLKATIGLSASSIGFTSESLKVAYEAWRKKDYDAALIFFPTWANSFMISFVASSTASLVGVNEIISRANYLIAASGNHVMMSVYLYCCFFFVVSSLLIMLLVKQLKDSESIKTLPKRLAIRYPQLQGV